MNSAGRNLKFDGIIFIVVLIVYLAGQFLIGTYHQASESFHFDAPADVDFLYYAGIINQMKHTFPPQNPAYGGVLLSQSFIQYYPTAIISMVTNPYTAMRIANIIYLILFALVLRNYFRRGWGAGLAVICAGSVGFGLLNSLGIDLIARGFTHFPFFIALVGALNEKKHLWLRYVCLFLLGWLHSYSAFLILLYLVIVVIVWKFEGQAVWDAVVALVGLSSAALMTLGVADKPFYFMLIEGFRLDLTHLWAHALAGAVLVIPTQNLRLYILFIVSFLFGLLFHYNPFFPIFLIYYATGMAVIDLNQKAGLARLLALTCMSLLFIGFILGLNGKYSPEKGGYLPHFDPEHESAGKWLENNTPGDAILLTLPLDSRWRCRLMEKRAVYLGFIPHVAHLGIDWRDRGRNIANYFANPDVSIAEIDYVVYGPAEKEMFFGFSLPGRPDYRDDNVTIWKVGN